MRAAAKRPWLIGAAVLTVYSLVPIIVGLIHVLRHGGVLTGTGATLAGADQQQYLASIRDSASHLLISNQFRLGASAHVYLNPMYLLSGALWRLGLDLRLALLLWTPIAAAGLAAGVWAYACRLLRPGERAAAVALAIFFFSPVLPALQWSGVHLSAHVHAALLLTSGDAVPAWQLWGYLHTVIVIGLMPLCLLAVERALRPDLRRGRSARWYFGWACAAGAVIGWLHPWQGLVLLAIICGLAAWGRFAPPYRRLAIPALATLAPMVYLYVLSRTNHDWRTFSLQNRAFHAPLWVLLAVLVPLVLPALAGVRAKVADDQERMLLLWPVAGIGVYLAVDQFPFHALQGISIPLSVLAVRAWRRLALRKLAGATCIALLTVPGLVYQLNTFRTNVDHRYAPYWLTDSENAALRYLKRAPVRGGVLSGYYLGMTVPALTGRSTWVGHYVWTPDFYRRVATANQLFDGQLPAPQARALVQGTGAAYVLADCDSAIDVARLLQPLVVSTRRFGCVGVYRLR